MTEHPRGDEGDVPWDGFIAGALGAVAVATWFLAVDLAQGQPLHAPSVLGTALLEGPGAAAHLEAIHTDVVAIYSGVHLAAFAVLGFAAAWLVGLHRRDRAPGWLLVLALVLLAVGHWLALAAFAPSLLGSLPAWQVLVGGLAAAVAMAGYFLLRHPDLLPGRGPGAGS